MRIRNLRVSTLSRLKVSSQFFPPLPLLIVHFEHVSIFLHPAATVRRATSTFNAFKMCIVAFFSLVQLTLKHTHTHTSFVGKALCWVSHKKDVCMILYYDTLINMINV